MTTVRTILPALNAAVDTATMLDALSPILRPKTLALARAAAGGADGTQCYAALHRAARLITARTSRAAADLMILGAATTDAQFVLWSAGRADRKVCYTNKREDVRAAHIRAALAGMVF